MITMSGPARFGSYGITAAFPAPAARAACQSHRFIRCDECHRLPTSFFGRQNGDDRQEPDHDLWPEAGRHLMDFAFNLSARRRLCNTRWA
jgi:hypothetical protein